MTTQTSLGFAAVPRRSYRHRANGVWFARLRAAVARWRERRLLEALDDRMLHDIGISRSQALAEARKPCWRA